MPGIGARSRQGYLDKIYETQILRIWLRPTGRQRPKARGESARTCAYIRKKQYEQLYLVDRYYHNNILYRVSRVGENLIRVYVYIIFMYYIYCNCIYFETWYK